MKKLLTLLHLLMVGVVVLGIHPSEVQATGTSNDPITSVNDITDSGTYLIDSVSGLIALQEFVNRGSGTIDYTFVYTRDIGDPDEGVVDWIPIGDENNPFQGTFRGSGVHYVGGLTMPEDQVFDYYGLFGVLGEGALVEQLWINSVFFRAEDDNDNISPALIATGSLAGLVQSGATVRDVVVTSIGASINITSSGVIGGLVGINSGLIENVTMYDVNLMLNSLDDSSVGGIVGVNYGQMRRIRFDIGSFDAGITLQSEGFAGGMIGSHTGLLEGFSFFAEGSSIFGSLSIVDPNTFGFLAGSTSGVIQNGIAQVVLESEDSGLSFIAQSGANSMESGLFKVINIFSIDGIGFTTYDPVFSTGSISSDGNDVFDFVGGGEWFQQIDPMLNAPLNVRYYPSIKTSGVFQSLLTLEHCLFWDASCLSYLNTFFRGTSDSTIWVAHPRDLILINDDVISYSKSFPNILLQSDVAFPRFVYPIDYRQIGAETNPFDAVFDGNGHTVFGFEFSFEDYSRSYDLITGFFAFTSGAVIQNVTFSGFHVNMNAAELTNLSSLPEDVLTGDEGIRGGLLIGQATSTVLSGVTVTDSSFSLTTATPNDNSPNNNELFEQTSGISFITVGGLIGLMDSGVIQNSAIHLNHTTLLGSSMFGVGGLIGVGFELSLLDSSIDTTLRILDVPESFDPPFIDDIGGIIGFVSINESSSSLILSGLTNRFQGIEIDAPNDRGVVMDYLGMVSAVSLATLNHVTGNQLTFRLTGSVATDGFGRFGGIVAENGNFSSHWRIKENVLSFEFGTTTNPLFFDGNGIINYLFENDTNEVTVEMNYNQMLVSQAVIVNDGELYSSFATFFGDDSDVTIQFNALHFTSNVDVTSGDSIQSFWFTILPNSGLLKNNVVFYDITGTPEVSGLVAPDLSFIEMGPPPPDFSNITILSGVHFHANSSVVLEDSGVSGATSENIFDFDADVTDAFTIANDRMLSILNAEGEYFTTSGVFSFPVMNGSDSPFAGDPLPTVALTSETPLCNGTLISNVNDITSAATYCIEDVSGLNALREFVNRGSGTTDMTFALTNDIDLSGLNWIPIGTFDETFSGNFDGNGFAIQNMTIEIIDPGEDIYSQGFFGQLKDAVVQRLTFEEPRILFSNLDRQLFNIGFVAGSVTADFDELETTLHQVFVVSGLMDINASRIEAIGGMVGTSDWTTINQSAITATSIKLNGQLQEVGAVAGNLLGSGLIDQGLYQVAFEIETDFVEKIGGLVGRTDNITVQSVYAEVNFESSSTLNQFGAAVGDTVSSTLLERNYINVITSGVDRPDLATSGVTVSGINTFDTSVFKEYVESTYFVAPGGERFIEFLEDHLLFSLEFDDENLSFQANFNSGLSPSLRTRWIEGLGGFLFDVEGEVSTELNRQFEVYTDPIWDLTASVIEGGLLSEDTISVIEGDALGGILENISEFSPDDPDLFLVKTDISNLDNMSNGSFFFKIQIYEWNESDELTITTQTLTVIVGPEDISGSSSSNLPGSFTIFGSNRQTVVSNLRITDLSGVELASGLSNQALSRLDLALIEFEITDLDGFDHIDVYIALYNTNSSVKETTASGLIDAINSGVTTQSLVIRWLSPERSAHLNTLAEPGPPQFTGLTQVFIKAGNEEINEATDPGDLTGLLSPTIFGVVSSSTWSVARTLAAESIEVDSGVRYRVTIPFRMSKVAPSSGVWNLGVKVIDRLQAEIDGDRSNEVDITTYLSDNDYGNLWYGEVSVVGPSAITFTGVQAGSLDFQSATQSGASAVELRFIANGPFNQEILTDSTWTTTNGVFAYLVADSGLTEANNIIESEGNRFALQVRRSDWDGDETPTDFVDLLPKSSGLVPLTTDDAYAQDANAMPKESQKAFIASVMTATPEEGIMARFEFQIRASKTFENGTYNGNISVNISNAPIGD